MKVLQQGHQTTNKVITRAPMNSRLYQMNYNTSKQQIRFYVATQWGRSQGKMNQKMDSEKMQVGKNLTYMPILRSIPGRMDRYDKHM